MTIEMDLRPGWKGNEGIFWEVQVLLTHRANRFLIDLQAARVASMRGMSDFSLWSNRNRDPGFCAEVSRASRSSFNPSRLHNLPRHTIKQRTHISTVDIY